MKQEPRPAIHMEKQLRWARKLGGAESLGIFKAGGTELARLMESQMWHQLAISVWMAVVSLIPSLSDFHSTQFLTILSESCSIF